MQLNAFAAAKRVSIYEALRAGTPPQEGHFELETWQKLATKGEPHMGSTRYHPDRIEFEFIYPIEGQQAGILTVTVDPPERIVMMPVPEWIIESIWQGEIAGSHHFESEANRLLSEYTEQLTKGTNEKWFGPQPAKRRE